MMTRVDEITSEKHLQASFIEFLEAITRVMERASISDINNLDQNDLEERKNLPLKVKIENTIPYLINLCQHKF
jgi:hypothetical protein